MLKKLLFLLSILLLSISLAGATAVVDTLRPTADDTVTGTWVRYPSDEGDYYPNIDEIVPDVDTTYISTKGTGADYVWRPPYYASHGTNGIINSIDSVTAVFRARITGSGTFKITIGRWHNVSGWHSCIIDAGDTNIFTLTTSHVDYSITYTRDPCTGLAFDTTTGSLNGSTQGWWIENTTGSATRYLYDTQAFLIVYAQVVAYQDTLRPYVDRYVENWKNFAFGESLYKTIDEAVADENTSYIYTDGYLALHYGWGHSTFTAPNIIDSVKYVDRVKATTADSTKLVLSRRMWNIEIGQWQQCNYHTNPTKTCTLTTSYVNYSITFSTGDPCRYTPGWEFYFNSSGLAWWSAVGFLHDCTGCGAFATQSYIVVFSHEAAGKFGGPIIQDEDNKSIIEGGISR